MNKNFIKLVAFSALVLSCDRSLRLAEYKQSQVNGIWKLSEGGQFGCEKFLAINDSTLYEIYRYAGVNTICRAENYSFDGQVIRFMLYRLNFEFQISDLTTEVMVLGFETPLSYTRVEEQDLNVEF